MSWELRVKSEVRRERAAFTLIEMLLVIGIMAILGGAVLAGMRSATKTAQKAKAQETVSNAAVALTSILQTNGKWPKILLDNSGQQLDENVSRVFVFNKGLMGLAYDTSSFNASTRKGTIRLIGADRCGVVTPWAATVLKNKRATSSTKMGRKKSGGAATVKDHVLWFAIDKDGDGIVSTTEGAPVDVRATAIAWCCGPTGDLDPYGTAPTGNAYSWNRNQEEK